MKNPKHRAILTVLNAGTSLTTARIYQKMSETDRSLFAAGPTEVSKQCYVLLNNLKLIDLGPDSEVNGKITKTYRITEKGKKALGLVQASDIGATDADRAEPAETEPNTSGYQIELLDLPSPVAELLRSMICSIHKHMRPAAGIENKSAKLEVLDQLIPVTAPDISNLLLQIKNDIEAIPCGEN